MTTAVKIAKAEAAAWRRKNPLDRPRPGWRLIDISNAQWWQRDADNRREMVFGKPRLGMWKFAVDISGHRIASGVTGTMSNAMAIAEEYGSLSAVETIGTA